MTRRQVSPEEQEYVARQLSDCGGGLALYVDRGTQRKGKKKESVRLVAVGEYAIICLKDGLTGKSTEFQRAIVDLQRIVEENGEISLEFSRNPKEPELELVMEDPAGFLTALVNAYRNMTYGMPPQQACIMTLSTPITPEEGEPQGEAAGIASAYTGYCACQKGVFNQKLYDFLNNRMHFSRVLALEEFSEFSNKSLNLRPLACALRYNTWFQSVSMNGGKRQDALLCAAIILSGNSTLTSLTVADNDAKDGIDKIGQALADNRACVITELDLSGNPIRGKAVGLLAQGLHSIRSSLTSLHMSDCDLNAKAIKTLLVGEMNSGIVAHKLDISKNRFGRDGTKSLSAWLNSPLSSRLQSLFISGTDADLVELGAGLCASDCVGCLQTLDIGGLTIDAKASKSMATVLRTIQLTELDVSGCHFAGTMPAILSAMTQLHRPKSVINMAGIDLSGDLSKVTAVLAVDGSNLHTLNLDDTQLGADRFIQMCEALRKARSLNVFSVSRVIPSGAKKRGDAIKALTGLITVVKVENLTIQGDDRKNFGAEMTPLLEVMATSKHVLHTLDVSGNKFGDAGCELLARALRNSVTLTGLAFDNNGLGSDGWQKLCEAIMGNFKIKNLALPVNDLAVLKGKLKKTQKDDFLKSIKDAHTHLSNLESGAVAEDPAALAAFELQIPRTRSKRLSSSVAHKAHMVNKRMSAIYDLDQLDNALAIAGISVSDGSSSAGGSVSGGGAGALLGPAPGTPSSGGASALAGADAAWWDEVASEGGYSSDASDTARYEYELHFEPQAMEARLASCMTME